MKFGDFSLFNKNETTSTKNEEDVSKFWLKCTSCKATMYYKEIQKKDNVCPKCNFHLKMNVEERINLIVDADSFIEFDNNLKPNDPIDFMDIKSYKKDLKTLKKK